MKSAILSFVIISLTSIAHAGLDDSIDQMCEKIKQCSTREMAQEEMAPELQQQMLAMFDGMCASMFEPHMKSVGQAGLEAKAEACVDSMVAESCDKLMAIQVQYRSEQCDDFENAAREAGLATGAE